MNAGVKDCGTQYNRLYAYNAMHCRCDRCVMVQRIKKRAYRARKRLGGK